MRPVFLPLAVLTLALAKSPSSAGDCSAEVLAAFEKQRTSRAFRIEMEQPSAEGGVKMTVDYIPPAKMLQTVVSPALPGEQRTMLVGERAFSGSNDYWEELLPQYSQSIAAEVKTAVGEAPRNPGSFECLGTVEFEGKAYTAYRTLPSAGATGAANETIARTIYVDPKSGLPALNVVGAVGTAEAPVAKVVYSYPDDIVIEAPVGAPVQKAPH